MLPPQAEGKEGPGEVAGCGAKFGALDLNHANWQSMASQLSQNGSSRTTSSRLQVDPVKLTREEPCSERREQRRSVIMNQRLAEPAAGQSTRTGGR